MEKCVPYTPVEPSVFWKMLRKRVVQAVLGSWDQAVRQKITKVSFAQQSLCESERARVQAAQKHTLVWALRQRPPADWHLPLSQEKDK